MNSNSINFLRESLAHHRDLRNALDHKASFLLAISGVIFTLSIGRLQEIQFCVLGISALLAAILSVFTIFSPFRKGVKKKFGLMCWWGFSEKSFEQYKDELEKVFTSDEAILREYMKEIWNLGHYSLEPKTRLLQWSSLILILGLLAGFILFFI